MKKKVIGVIILFLGVLLLLKNLGFLYYGFYDTFISWQMLLIVIGLVILSSKKTNNRNAGAILICIGVIFLIPRVFHIQLNHILIPSLLIIGGLSFIIKAASSRKRLDEDLSGAHQHSGDFDSTSFDKSSLGDQEYVKREYVFSGSKERWSYAKIKYVDVSAVFSGVELDLIDTELSPEVEKVHIKISSVFSGVTIYVPDNWNIVIQKTGVFGGFADKRPLRSLPLGGKLVVLELEAVFGGGEIRYYE